MYGGGYGYQQAPSSAGHGYSGSLDHGQPMAGVGAGAGAGGPARQLHAATPPPGAHQQAPSQQSHHQQYSSAHASGLPPPPPSHGHLASSSSAHGHAASANGRGGGGDGLAVGNPFYAQGEDPSYASGFTHGTAAEPFQAYGYEEEAKMPLTDEKYAAGAYPPRQAEYG